MRWLLNLLKTRKADPKVCSSFGVLHTSTAPAPAPAALQGDRRSACRDPRTSAETFLKRHTSTDVKEDSPPIRPPWHRIDSGDIRRYENKAERIAIKKPVGAERGDNLELRPGAITTKKQEYQELLS
ncbi:hypothetical protein CC77DRAFT_1053914 [Alternaria alternata]|uniref:Uncharacterized protein n=1 Tax=Alternaria alternata TaxID=5599 RepID=A0A177D9C2_ALTAL|nr:hypothetical protein CC77DRAFT_1053914 [Alternaria alternata]OAG15780.1 hypothetical protein CC77DRAFT_1053914 [Alternaria alternata]